MSETKAEIGILNFAHSYSACARKLQNDKIGATHQQQVVRFLYYHSIELYLKSFLVANGVTEKELSSKKLGHMLHNLALKAMHVGLRLEISDLDILSHLQMSGNIIDSRYIKIGTKRMINIEAIYELCRYLHNEVVKVVYSSISGSRIPSLEPPEMDKLKALDLSRH